MKLKLEKRVIDEDNIFYYIKYKEHWYSKWKYLIEAPKNSIEIKYPECRHLVDIDHYADLEISDIQKIIDAINAIPKNRKVKIG